MSKKSEIVKHGKNYFTVYSFEQFMQVVEHQWAAGEGTRGYHHGVQGDEKHLPQSYPVTVQVYVKYGPAGDDPQYITWSELDLALLNDIVKTRAANCLASFTRVVDGGYLVRDRAALLEAYSDFIRFKKVPINYHRDFLDITPDTFPAYVAFTLDSPLPLEYNVQCVITNLALMKSTMVGYVF